MKPIAIVRSRGRITLPLEVRKRLKLEPGTKLRFIIIEEQQLEVIPITESITCLKGMVPKPKRPLTVSEMENVITEGVISRLNP